MELDVCFSRKDERRKHVFILFDCENKWAQFMNRA